MRVRAETRKFRTQEKRGEGIGKQFCVGGLLRQKRPRLSETSSGSTKTTLTGLRFHRPGLGVLVAVAGLPIAAAAKLKQQGVQSLVGLRLIPRSLSISTVRVWFARIPKLAALSRSSMRTAILHRLRLGREFFGCYDNTWGPEAGHQEAPRPPLSASFPASRPSVQNEQLCLDPPSPSPPRPCCLC